jgi:primosomal protein N' (replication factor Y)
MSTSSLGNNFRVLEPISGSAYLSDALEQPQPWVEVLVDCPGAQELFIYHLPSSLEVHPGDILSVAFGSQQVGAIAIRLLSQLPPELEPTQIREVEEVISAGFFPGTYWRLLEQVARYYHTPLIQAIRVALPPGLLARSQRRIRLIVKDLPPTVPDLLSPAACQLLQLLQANSSVDYTWKYLQHQVKGAQRGLRELSQRGWVQSYLKPQSAARNPGCVETTRW